MLLTHRKLLQSKAIAVDNDLRGTLRNFGLKVSMVGTAKFEARIKELGREPVRFGRSGGTAAHRPAGASRADRRPASPFTGHRRAEAPGTVINRRHTSSSAHPSYHFKRIGIEAGPLSQWFYTGR